MGKRTKTVRIVYKNWRGEVGERTIQPVKIWYGATEWHPEKQWFLKAFDIDKQAERDFALIDIIHWKQDV